MEVSIIYWKIFRHWVFCKILIYFIAKQSATPRTKEIENLLTTGCLVVDLRVNPRMIPFFTPLTPTEGSQCMAAYIAPINYNRVDSKMVTSIMSTTQRNYCRDKSKDNTHLQDMCSDAAVLFGYYDKSVSMWIKIFIVCLFWLPNILTSNDFHITFRGKNEKRNMINLVALNPNVTLAEKDGFSRPLFPKDDLLLTTVKSKNFKIYFLQTQQKRKVET